MSKAIEDVIAERARQIEQEGWTPEHDDQHVPGSLSHAGACYALYGENFDAVGEPPPHWQWGRQWWKPAGMRRNLVRAAALIIAEIERLDRAEAREVKK